MHFLQPNIIDLGIRTQKRFNPASMPSDLYVRWKKLLEKLLAENYPLVLRGIHRSNGSGRTASHGPRHSVVIMLMFFKCSAPFYLMYLWMFMYIF